MRYVLWLTPLLALLALACGGGAGSGRTPTPTAEVQAPTPEPTATAAPTATPEPTVETLAFIHDGDIWLIDADGSNRRRVTQFGGTDREVVSFEWLANGQEIAYRVSLPFETGSPPFISGLASVDGQVLWERELRASPVTGVFWSPEGQLVAVFDQLGVSIEDRDGWSVWTGELGTDSLQASWSPDSNDFAFVDGNEVVVVSRDGTSVNRLYVGPTLETSVEKGDCTRSEDHVFGPLTFSPDNRRLVVAVGCRALQGAQNFVGAVYEASLDQQINRPIAGAEVFGGLGDSSFAPDGRYVAYVTSVYLSACESYGGLSILGADGGSARTFVPAEITEAVETYTPGGPDASRQWAVYLSGLGFDWSPGADAVVAAFQMRDCSFFSEPPVLVEGIYAVRADGVAEEKLVDEFTFSGPVWSPSGDLIAYAVGDPNAPQIRVFDLLTRQVTDLGPGTSPAWRPLPPEAVSLPWEGEVTDNLRIRSEPNTGSDIVAALEKGSEVRVYGEAEGEEAESGSGNRIWYRVIGGWVYSAFVER